ncbi:MAG TPA: HEPN domain-containing protein [archaeon]|nr:HEPN domain-containing protein [archaeon]
MDIRKAEAQIRKFERKGLLAKTESIKRLTGNFMYKARHNLETAAALWNLSEEKDAKKLLKISEAYEGYDWVIVISYYSMYHAAMAALASIEIKSDSHKATILALWYNFVHKGELEEKYMDSLKKARSLEELYVSKIRAAKRRRIMAQYFVDISLTREEAEAIRKDASDFINRIDELIS